MGSLPQYSSVDVVMVALWTVIVAVSFLCVGYCMGRREDAKELMGAAGRRIVEMVKPREPEPEPRGDIWEDVTPTAMVDRGR